MANKALRTPDHRFQNLPGWPYTPCYVDGRGYNAAGVKTDDAWVYGLRAAVKF
jgi:hypothetical protein